MRVNIVNSLHVSYLILSKILRSKLLLFPYGIEETYKVSSHGIFVVKKRLMD
jgi:hypothetical protein